MVLTEAKLVAAAEGLTGADAEFTAVVERQSRFVFSVAYAVLRNIQDAEDVVQDTFLKLYRSGGLRDVRDERAFLARAAWRVAAGRVKRRREEPPDLDAPSGEQSPETAAVEADWNATVHRLIDALPEELRQPLALSALEEMDSKAIAQVMGIPEGTVRTRIMRARTILRQKLEALKEGRHAR